MVITPILLDRTVKCLIMNYDNYRFLKKFKTRDIKKRTNSFYGEKL